MIYIDPYTPVPTTRTLPPPVWLILTSATWLSSNGDSTAQESNR